MEWIIINIIESILLTWFISSLVDIKDNKFLYRLLLVLSNFIVITTSNYLNMYDVFLTTLLIVMNVGISYQFVNNDLSVILFIICFENVFNVSTIILSVIINNILSMDLIDPLGKIFYLLLGFIIIKYINTKTLYFQTSIYYMMALILFGLQFIMQHFLQVYLILRVQITDIFLSFIMLFMCVLGLLLMLFKVSSMNKDQEDYKILKQQKENEQSLSFLYEQLKITKHDLKHDYDLLDYYINNQDEEKVKEFIHSKKSTMEIMPTLIHCQNELINIIINNKMIQAYTRGIEVNCEISVNEDINMSDFDLNNLLSNILDNAIENCIENGKISIHLLQDNTYLHIKVINTIDEEVYLPNLKTKKDKIHHGFGLKSIQRITNIYDGIMDIEKIENIFQIKITLLIK